MRFNINLATRTYLDSELTRVALVFALFLAILFCWKFFQFFQNKGKLEQLKNEIVSLEDGLKPQSFNVSEREYKTQRQSVVFYNEIIERKSAYWLRLLDQLEQVTPEGIAVFSLTPDKKTGVVKIEGRTRHFSSVSSYLERLGNSGTFSDVLLLSHTEFVVGPKRHGVQFVISCRMVK